VPILHALPAREEALGETTLGTVKLSASGVPGYDERRIDEGCRGAASTFFFQTQRGMYAKRADQSRASGAGREPAARRDILSDRGPRALVEGNPEVVAGL
jgi:hypothetical protein